jgi:adenosine deaminase
MADVVSTWVMQLGDWRDQVPKVELHVHLEGAIPLPALWGLIEKYGGDPGVPDLQALERRFAYRDFAQFIEIWVWKNGFLRELEDFTHIAEAVALHLREQRILYAEAFYSPPDFARHGLGTQDLTTAIRAGLDRVDGVRVNLVADLVRDFGPLLARRTLAEVAEVRREGGVVGIGIGGSEQSFPPEPFAAVYQRARELGFRTSAHAGEAAGPESIWGALRALHVDRIGHGTRAGEDEALLDHLAEHRVPLEMCPVSNVRTGVVRSLEEHPLIDFMERGLLVTVSTDDPAMFQTSLAGEFRALGLTREQVRTLVLAGVEGSWLEGDASDALAGRIAADPSWD